MTSKTLSYKVACYERDSLVEPENPFRTQHVTTMEVPVVDSQSVMNLFLIVAFGVSLRLSVWKFTVDDAYINYAYAKGIYKGSVGYSTPLFVSILRLFKNPEIASKLMGLSFSALNILLAYFIAFKYLNNEHLSLLAASFVALDPLEIKWSVSGMEASFFTALLLSAAYFYPVSAVFLLLSALTRYEGGFILVAAFVFSGFSVDLGLALIALGTYYIWQYRKFGEIAPTTFSANKIQTSITGPSFLEAFIRLFLSSYPVPFFLLIYTALHANSFILSNLILRGDPLILWPLVLFSAYVYANSGRHPDRYTAHFSPFMLLLTTVFLTYIPQMDFFAVAGTYAISIVPSLYVVVKGSIEYARGLKTAHLEIAKWLRDNTPEQTLVAVHDAGLIGYVSGRRTVDLLGLITPEAVPYLKDGKTYDFVEKVKPNYFVTRQEFWLHDAVLRGHKKGFSLIMQKSFAKNYTVNLYRLNWD